MPSDDGRLAYLARVASLYYDQRKTQQEVADDIGVSRSAVSRLLTEAREKGIVEIIVHYPWRNSPELERALTSSFGLRAARVLLRESKSYEQMLQGIGTLAACYLSDILHNGVVIGVSWGTALYQTVMAMRQMALPAVEVVQMIGAVGSEDALVDGPVLAQLLANRLGGRYRYLHAPLTVQSEAGRAALLQERNIREALERAEQADVALVGIGSTVPELYSLLRAGYVSEEEAKRIREAGAVGDICAQHYALSGEWLDIEINRRIVGISLQKLSEVDVVIGVAGDVRKAPAILGALRGGYLDVLVTDDQAARRILELNESRLHS